MLEKFFPILLTDLKLGKIFYANFFLICENQALACSLLSPTFHHWFNSVIGAVSDQ